MLSNRSYEKELLDQDLIPFAEIKQNMKELNFINTWLGGHNITVGGFKQLAEGKKEVSVCEIGCGGGDNLLAIYKWCKTKNIKIHITGVDIKEECITYSKSRKEFPSSAIWITSDYSVVQFNPKPDIIFSSLFCHHFTQRELIFQLKWMQANCLGGFFINDLQRHILAYYSIKLLTRVFSNSRLVKNDAPLSVARGFTRKEIETLCSDAGIENASIKWKWAFRYLVVYQQPSLPLV